MPSVSKKYAINLVEYGGRKNLVPVFTSYTFNQLGISKSYYNKILRKLKEGDILPKTMEKRMKNIKPSLEIKQNTKIPLFKTEKIVQQLIKQKKVRYKGNDGTIKEKIPKYIWVKFELYSGGRNYWQSMTLDRRDINKLSKKIRDYIDIFIKKYDEFSTFINSITLSNV